MEAFLAAGATEVVPETFESSLMLFTHVMALLRHDRADTEAALDRVRADRYHLLHGVIAGERHSLYPENWLFETFFISQKTQKTHKLKRIPLHMYLLKFIDLTIRIT